MDTPTLTPDQWVEIADKAIRSVPWVSQRLSRSPASLWRSYEDFRAVAFHAIAHAVASYQPDSPLPLVNYAALRSRNAVMDFNRRLSPVPRSVQILRQKQHHGEYLSPADREQITQWEPDTSVPAEPCENPWESLSLLPDEAETLWKIVDSLPQQEATVVSLVYRQNLTYREAAEVVGVSFQRIGQIVNQALHHLRFRCRKESWLLAA